MDLSKIKDKWIEIVSNCNEKGIPIPLARDHGVGSVSLTLTLISFTLCAAGIIGKWSGALGGIDVSNAFQLFLACGGLYWGRKISKTPKDITIEKSETEKKP
jgi:hypothetical protein